MSIDSQGDTDRAVPQALMHDLGVDFHRDRDGCRTVAHIMEAKCAEPGLMQHLFDLMDSHSL